MSTRVQDWLRKRAALDFERGGAEFKPYPFRLTPGQYAELCAELGYAPVTSLETKLGTHPVERLSYDGRATGDNVILCPRPDLFFEAESDVGIQVYHENSVTSIPDNVGCCEVLSVGEMVTAVKPGDVAFIDFFDVKQGYVLCSDEVYLAPGDAFKALWKPTEHQIVPLANYVVTKRNSRRMKIAMSGSDTVHVPDYMLTGGFVSGKTSVGSSVQESLYEEVVAVGPLTGRPRPGVMTKAERALIDRLTRCEAVEYDALDAQEAEAINAVRAERAQGRAADIAVGELVGFCKQVATPLRIRGDFHHLVHYDNVLAAIDDAAILEQAITSGHARMVVGL